MSYLLLVAVSNCLQNLLDHNRSFRLRKFFPFNNLVEQLASLAELCYQVNLFLVLEDFVKPDNVGVVQVFENINFILESHPFDLAHLVLVYDLHRANLTSRFALALLDPAKRALA